MIARRIGPFGVGTRNPLRDRLLSIGEECLAEGVDRHDITSLEGARELIDNAYGWSDADTSSELETIRSLVRILDGYSRPTDTDLLHWL